MLKVINIGREAVFCRNTCKVGDVELKSRDIKYSVVKTLEKAWVNPSTMYYFGKTPNGETFAMGNTPNSLTIIFDAQGNKKSNVFFNEADANREAQNYNAEKEAERVEKETQEKSDVEEIQGETNGIVEESEVMTALG